MAAPPPDFSIVLPAHNEAANIAPMIAALAQVVAPLGRFEIVFVDDGSSDGTLDGLRAAAARDPLVRYVSFTRNFGHEAALRAGLRHARGRAVMVMDCRFRASAGAHSRSGARVAQRLQDRDRAAARR